MPRVITNPKQFGRALREARVERSLSQEQLGKLCGLTKGGVSAMERGETGPSQSVFNKLIHALNLPRRKFTQWSKQEGKDMEATGTDLKTIQEDIAGLKEAIKAMGGPGQDKPALTEVVGDKSTKGQIINAVADLAKRVEQIENGMEALGSEEVEEAVEEAEVPTTQKSIEGVVDKFDKAGAEIGFFDDLFETEEKTSVKEKAHHESVELCKQGNVDPDEEIKDGLFDGAKRADKMTDVLYDFAREKIDKKEAVKDLVRFLAGESNPGDGEEGLFEGIFE